MEQIANQVIFYLLAAVIVIFSVLTVTTRRILRAATYLLLCCLLLPVSIFSSIITSSVQCKLLFMQEGLSFCLSSQFY